MSDELVTVAIEESNSAGSSASVAGSTTIRVLNPSARRQVWAPSGWSVRRLQACPADMPAAFVPAEAELGRAITLMPGELVALEIKRL